MLIYLDHTATTRVSPRAKEAFLRALDRFGNPSSLHPAGAAAAAELRRARETLARLLGCEPGEVVFTPSGSAANNLAVFGTVRGRHGRVIATGAEHPSVYECVKECERQGCEAVFLPSKGGCLDLAALEAALTPDTLLVSAMLVNNETGGVSAVDRIAPLLRARAPRAKLHVDAVQGFMKLPFTVGRLGCDLLTVSAHKVGAPRGAAALYIKKGQQLRPLVFGGGQESGLVSGTENVAAIAAFAAAADERAARMEEDYRAVAALRTALLPQLPGAARVNEPARGVPHILSLTLPGIRSETLLHFLEARGICVSAGSACSAHKKGPSRALLDFGLTVDEADSTLRISLGAENTPEELAALAAALREAERTLQKK